MGIHAIYDCLLLAPNLPTQYLDNSSPAIHAHAVARFKQHRSVATADRVGKAFDLGGLGSGANLPGVVKVTTLVGVGRPFERIEAPIDDHRVGWQGTVTLVHRTPARRAVISSTVRKKTSSPMSVTLPTCNKKGRITTRDWQINSDRIASRFFPAVVTNSSLRRKVVYWRGKRSSNAALPR